MDLRRCGDRRAEGAENANGKDARLKRNSRRPLQIQKQNQLQGAGGTPALQNQRQRLPGSMKLKRPLQRRRQRQSQKRIQRSPPQKKKKQAAATNSTATATATATATEPAGRRRYGVNGRSMAKSVGLCHEDRGCGLIRGRRDYRGCELFDVGFLFDFGGF